MTGVQTCALPISTQSSKLTPPICPFNKKPHDLCDNYLDIHRLANIATSDGLLLLTTNFDLLLETAGCPPNRIQHLHGAIDAPDTMKFRLNLVGRGLRGQKQRVGAVALKGRSLFVFGYSFNDEDIRQLVKGSPPVSLYWHLKNKQDWALRNISLLKSVKTPIFLSFGDLHAVFDSLAGNVAPWSIHTSANPFKLPRQNLIAEASRNIVNHEREAILAVCLTEAHCGDGLKALKKRIFDRPRCRLDVETYLALTIGFRTLRMASECLSCCQRALALLSEADGCVFARAWNLR